AIGERDAVMAWLNRAGGVAAAMADLSRALDIDPADSRERVNAEIVEGPNLPSSHWIAVAAALAKGSAADQKPSSCPRAAAAASGEERVRTYLRFFLTGAGEPRKILVTRAVEAGDPDLADRLCAERTRLLPLEQRRRALAARERTGALLALAGEV